MILKKIHKTVSAFVFNHLKSLQLKINVVKSDASNKSWADAVAFFRVQENKARQKLWFAASLTPQGSQQVLTALWCYLWPVYKYLCCACSAMMCPGEVLEAQNKAAGLVARRAWGVRKWRVTLRTNDGWHWVRWRSETDGMDRLWDRTVLLQVCWAENRIAKTTGQRTSSSIVYS